MAHATNDKSVFTKQMRDTNTHYLPSVAADGVAAYDVRGQDIAVAKIVNDLDQAVVVSLECTTFDDSGMAKPDTEVVDVTVNAGKVESLRTDTPWAYVRVKAVCAVAPAAGELKVVFQSDRRK